MCGFKFISLGVYGMFVCLCLQQNGDYNIVI